MALFQESQFGEVFILGMPFLRYYFTVFDRRKKQVHIARSSADCKALGPESLEKASALAGEAPVFVGHQRHGTSPRDALNVGSMRLSFTASTRWTSRPLRRHSSRPSRPAIRASSGSERLKSGAATGL